LTRITTIINPVLNPDRGFCSTIVPRIHMIQHVRMHQCIAGLIPCGFQLQALVTLASLGWCHISSECMKSCAHRSVCFCSQSGGGTSVRLLT
jgi:hypothetical protein